MLAFFLSMIVLWNCHGVLFLPLDSLSGSVFVLLKLPNRIISAAVSLLYILPHATCDMSDLRIIISHYFFYGIVGAPFLSFPVLLSTRSVDVFHDSALLIAPSPFLRFSFWFQFGRYLLPPIR